MNGKGYIIYYGKGGSNLPSNKDNEVKRFAKIMALLFYHLSKEVIDEFGERGRDVIKRAVEKFGTERGKSIREKVVLRGKPLTMENLSKYYDMPLKSAWEADTVTTEKTYDSKVYYCPFAEVWLSKNAPEIGLLYCEQDIALMKAYNPDIEFKRPKNLLNGDGCCLFDVKIKDKKGS